MPNKLTGAYEAVLLVRLRQINGILGTLHHSRVDPAASPSFPHSVRMRLGSSPFADIKDVVRFRNWTLEAASAAGGASSPQAMRQIIAGKGPPGVAAFFDSAWTTLDRSAADLAGLAALGSVRGEAEIQIATPTISVPPGAGSQLTIHAHIRARFTSAVSSSPLPELIHGEVRARYIVQRRALGSGKVVLRVEASSDDSQIQFLPEPGSGASAADVQHIGAEVRTALRERFKALDVELPPDFAFSEFRILGSGADEAMVLPFQLSGGLAPAGGLGTITSSFLGPAEFAIGISRERVQTVLDQVIGSIQASAAAMNISVSGPLGTARYTVSVPTVNMAWKAGQIDLSSHINLTTDRWWAPNGFISFKQTITAVLDVPTGRVSLQAVGDPAVDESWWMPHGKAVTAVTQARDRALPVAGASLHTAIDSARLKLLAGLQSFDSFAAVRFTGIEITPDGVILRGAIGTGGRVMPRVRFDEIDGGTAFSAFSSWIPGGRIRSFTWSWVEYVHPIPWFNKTQSVEETHRFICPKSPSMVNAGHVCLQVSGSRISSDGLVEEGVTGGDVCKVTGYEPILVVPPWAFEAIVPIWRVDPPPDAILSKAITGHLNVAGGRLPGTVAPNVLVLFTGDTIDSPLRALSRAVDMVQRREASLMVFVVLPEGAFDMRRADLDARLGDAPRDLAAALTITEDYNGGWSRIFGARTGTPSMHLLNARGEAVWSREGAAADAVGAALRQYLEPAPPPANRPLRLTVEAGDAAPDAMFRDVDGNEFALRRLRRGSLLAFWQSWSTPSISELQRLETQHRRGGGPMVIAINSGEDRERIAEVRRRLDLTLPLVVDADRTLAARYGVRCWPTTIAIGENGFVAHVHFGLTHEHRADGKAADGGPAPLTDG